MKLWVNENLFFQVRETRNANVARLLVNEDASSINKSSFIKRSIYYTEPEFVMVLLESGFVSSVQLRDELIEIASSLQNKEMLSLLLDYKNKTVNFD